MSDNRLAMSFEELAQRNGANLLALQLQTELKEKVEASRRHDEEIRTLRSQLDQAQRIGVKVMQANSDGRKTIRIADLVDTRAAS